VRENSEEPDGSRRSASNASLKSASSHSVVVPLA
jgi:hypothetical protein